MVNIGKKKFMFRLYIYFCKAYALTQQLYVSNQNRKARKSDTLFLAGTFEITRLKKS